MRKSLRSLILVATVALAAAPALHAEVMGTNPRPVGHVVRPSISQALLSFFGF